MAPQADKASTFHIAWLALRGGVPTACYVYTKSHQGAALIDQAHVAEVEQCLQAAPCRQVWKEVYRRRKPPWSVPMVGNTHY